MPKFEMLPIDEALVKAATGKRADLLREYIGYIEQTAEGQAGRLEPEEGETPTAVRRRLTAAAKVAGKELVVKRAGDVVYFWQGERGTRKRRGPSQAEDASAS